jgi:hypothetical protein
MTIKDKSGVLRPKVFENQRGFQINAVEARNK